MGGEYKCLTLEPVGLAHARTSCAAQLNADDNGWRRAFKSFIVKGLQSVHGQPLAGAKAFNQGQTSDCCPSVHAKNIEGHSDA